MMNDSGPILITDHLMREQLKKAKEYCIVILRPGPDDTRPDAKEIIWSHGRRFLELRAAGKLRIVCPVRDESDVAGLGIFATDLAETERIMQDDPAVRAGVLTFKAHPCVGFPGDSLA